MVSNQKRYRILAGETLLGRPTNTPNWEYVCLFFLGLPVIGAGILPVDEIWFRFLILLIAIFVFGKCFNQTKIFIKITGTLRQSLSPHCFVYVWRETLIKQVAKLVLPYVSVTAIIGLIRYGFTSESTKAVALVVGAATLGVVLAINFWDGRRFWYDYLFAVALLILLSWAWVNWPEQHVGKIYGPLVLLLASFTLLPILYRRIDYVVLKQAVVVRVFQNSREYLANLFRFQNLSGEPVPQIASLLALGPAVAILTIFYNPINFDSRFVLRLLQAPMVVAVVMACIVTTRLHWRYFLLPKLRVRERVGTTTLLATSFVLLTSLAAWISSILILNLLLKITFGVELPLKKFWFPVEQGLLIIELYVWIALSIWLAAYLVKPRGLLRKPAKYLEDFYMPIIIVGITSRPFDRKLTWEDRIGTNAREILTGDTIFTFFAACAILITVFTHLANRAWAKRDISEILEKHRS